ncbi:MAG TPA: hypothetical protein VGD00_06400 [Solirubrobacteraceae bacterium]
MRAVNLIPTEQRGGQHVGAGRSGGAAYAFLALLAGIALLAVLYGKAHRDISGREAKAATLTAEAQRAQSEASALAPYTSFAALRVQREQAVETLVDSRFDWAHAFHELGRVLTAQTAVSSLTGQIAPAGPATSAAAPTPASPSPTAAAAAASSVSSATPPGSVPVFTLSGCAKSQRAVAQMLVRLRLMDGVSAVALQSSSKGAGGSGASSGGACPASFPSFTVGVTYAALPSAAAAAAATKPGAENVSSAGGKAG